MSDDLRNRIEVRYSVAVPTRVPRTPVNLWERALSLFGWRPTMLVTMRPSVIAQDEESIARYGERWMLVEADESFDEAQARTLAEQCLADLTAQP